MRRTCGPLLAALGIFTTGTVTCHADEVLLTLAAYDAAPVLAQRVADTHAAPRRLGNSASPTLSTEITPPRLRLSGSLIHGEEPGQSFTGRDGQRYQTQFLLSDSLVLHGESKASAVWPAHTLRATETPPPREDRILVGLDMRLQSQASVDVSLRRALVLSEMVSGQIASGYGQLKVLVKYTFHW